MILIKGNVKIKLFVLDIDCLRKYSISIHKNGINTQAHTHKHTHISAIEMSFDVVNANCTH